MALSQIDLSIEKLNRIFPFHLVIDSDLNIFSAGKSLVKSGIDCEKKRFDTFFEIDRPNTPDITFEALCALENELVILSQKKGKGYKIRGQFEYFEDRRFVFFIGSPWFGSINQLKEYGLNMLDFAKYDPLFDLLHILKSQEITNNEIKELLNKVTEQKKKAVQINNQLSLFQQILDSSTDAMQVAFTDGRLFYINKEASRRLGIQMSEVRNYKVSDFEQIFKEENVWESHVQELRNKGMMILEGLNINQSNQSTFPVEVTVTLIEIQGQEYIIASSRDITSRKQFDEQLRLQEEKYRNIIANMNLGLLEVDNEENILFANQGFCEMSGYTIEELVGSKTTEILQLGEYKKEILNKKEVRKNGISDSYEISVKVKDGLERWWFISGAPNYNDDQEHVGSIGIHLDITNQKLLEKELEIAKHKAEDASKAKELFLANMSHEIRTPLNAIIGMIRELGREDLNAKQQSYLSHTDTAAQHLLNIVNSILDISKIEAGELELDLHHFSLQALLGNLKSILYSKALENKIDLIFEISDDIHPSLIGDSNRLRQVLLNLLDNSIKFTQNGFVKLILEVVDDAPKKQDIRFRIIDTGIGMTKEYVKDVFSKFSQEELSTSRKYGGTGLGMSISYEFIQLMDGEIIVESEKGKGTQIIIDLSMEKGDPSQLTNNSKITKENDLKGIRVLLVEDNVMNRFIALQSLQYFGCLVDEAENGKIAIEKLKVNSYDIILMDIQMPEMDGVETTKYIRNTLKSDVPIIAMTANAFKKDIDLYLSIGMDDYVTKPFEENVLQNVMKNQIQSRLTPPIDETDTETPLYDLSKLIEISRGDDSFIQSMIKIFVEHIPQSLKEMEEAFELEDYETVGKIAHRIKPSIDNMGIDLLKGVAKEIELMCKNSDLQKDALRSRMDKLSQVLFKVIDKILES